MRPPLTPELRRSLGLPAKGPAPYPWALALLVVATGFGPLWFASYHKAAWAFGLLGLGVLPAMRWLEGREQKARERLYHEGKEGYAEVLEVEPAGEQRNDHLVRLAIFADGKRIETMVTGCPLARRGLGPGDEVRVAYDEADPRRCLVLERTRREIVDAI